MGQEEKSGGLAEKPRALCNLVRNGSVKQREREVTTLALSLCPFCFDPSGPWGILLHPLTPITSAPTCCAHAAASTSFQMQSQTAVLFNEVMGLENEALPALQLGLSLPPSFPPKGSLSSWMMVCPAGLTSVISPGSSKVAGCCSGNWRGGAATPSPAVCETGQDP